MITMKKKQPYMYIRNNEGESEKWQQISGFKHSPMIAHDLVKCSDSNRGRNMQNAGFLSGFLTTRRMKDSVVTKLALREVRFHFLMVIGLPFSSMLM